MDSQLSWAGLSRGISKPGSTARTHLSRAWWYLNTYQHLVDRRITVDCEPGLSPLRAGHGVASLAPWPICLQRSITNPPLAAKSLGGVRVPGAIGRRRRRRIRHALCLDELPIAMKLGGGNRKLGYALCSTGAWFRGAALIPMLPYRSPSQWGRSPTFRAEPGPPAPLPARRPSRLSGRHCALFDLYSRTKVAAQICMRRYIALWLNCSTLAAGELGELLVH